MNYETGGAKSTSGSEVYLYVASLVRRALANTADANFRKEALRWLETVPSEVCGLRPVPLEWLHRCFQMFLCPQATSTLLKEAAERLPETLEELLWLLECEVECPQLNQQGHQWLHEWRERLSPALQEYLLAPSDSWEALWQQAQAAETTLATDANLNAAEPDTGTGNELLEAFLAEVDEGLRHAEELLLQLERTPDNRELLHALFRQYHTLKGAASAVDLEQAVAQLHEGEALLQALRDGELELPPSSVVDFFLKLGDSVRALVDEACGRPCTTAKIRDLDGAIAALLCGEPPSPPSNTAVPPLQPAQGHTQQATQAVPPKAPAPSEFPQLRALREKAARGQLDPELLAVIETLQQRAEFFSAMATSLQAEVQQLRTVPAEDVLRRLARPVRDAARIEGKQVRLETVGGSVRIPKNLADPLTAILLHLVRNCVAHGIETPETRAASAKPTEGLVQVEIEAKDACLYVTVSDDGRGLDYDGIRKKAAALGLLPPTPSGLSPDFLASLLFRPGFSTREVPNELAGRGVGLDVVASEVHQLGGEVRIRSTPGYGTRVEIVLPTGTLGAAV